jgi:hypothetical protein
LVCDNLHNDTNSSFLISAMPKFVASTEWPTVGFVLEKPPIFFTKLSTREKSLTKYGGNHTITYI